LMTGRPDSFPGTTSTSAHSRQSISTLFPPPRHGSGQL
jgi:hypothetical protein